MKKMIFALLLVVCFASVSFAQADQITLTTYYPAPFGMYQEMRVMGKLGVGTTNPQAKAHISDEDNVKNVTLTVENTGTQGVDLWLKRPGATQTSTIIFGNAGNFGTLSFGDGNHFAFNRNVGIGTPAPYAPLHVKNDGNSNYTSVFEEPGNTMARYAILAFQGMQPQSPATKGGIFVKTVSDSYGIYQLGSAANYFASNVGVGITNPLAKLQVEDNASAAVAINQTGASDGDYALVVSQNAVFSKAVPMSKKGGIYINTPTAGSYGIYQPSPNPYNYFNGNVGIGTTAPICNLHVRNNNFGYSTTLENTSSTNGPTVQIFNGVSPASWNVKTGILLNGTSDSMGIYQAGGLANYFEGKIGIETTAVDTGSEASLFTGGGINTWVTGASSKPVLSYALASSGTTCSTACSPAICVAGYSYATGASTAATTSYGCLYTLSNKLCLCR